jgi:hypothetical protein
MARTIPLEGVDGMFPSWMSDIKVTKSRASRTSKEGTKHYVRLTFHCKCSQGASKIDPSGWYCFTTDREALQKVLQHPKVLAASCCSQTNTPVAAAPSPTVLQIRTRSQKRQKTSHEPCLGIEAMLLSLTSDFSAAEPIVPRHERPLLLASLNDSLAESVSPGHQQLLLPTSSESVIGPVQPDDQHTDIDTEAKLHELQCEFGLYCKCSQHAYAAATAANLWRGDGEGKRDVE